MNFEEGKTIVKEQLRILEKPHNLMIIKKWNRTLGLILSGFSILCILITGFIFGGFSENYFDFSAPFPIIAFQLIFVIVPMFFFSCRPFNIVCRHSSHFQSNSHSGRKWSGAY